MTRTPDPKTRRSHPAEFRPADSHRHHELRLRPRYVECDPMGIVHHSVYPVWFEMGRTEMLRGDGGSYRDLETAGIFLVVADLSIRFRMPARYDDELLLRTHLLEGGRARIRHGYELCGPDGSTLATATTTIACVDSAGNLKPIPEAVAAMGVSH
ncbi:MAG: thioesterase [Planctomycetaceae bacterium]|nr:thioesterase [Planctomycetaceae bacterium]